MSVSLRFSLANWALHFQLLFHYSLKGLSWGQWSPRLMLFAFEHLFLFNASPYIHARVHRVVHVQMCAPRDGVSSTGENVRQLLSRVLSRELPPGLCHLTGSDFSGSGSLLGGLPYLDLLFLLSCWAMKTNGSRGKTWKKESLMKKKKKQDGEVEWRAVSFGKFSLLANIKKAFSFKVEATEIAVRSRDFNKSWWKQEAEQA